MSEATTEQNLLPALIDDLYAARQKATEASRIHDEAKKRVKELEAQVMSALDDVGITGATGVTAKVAVSEEVVPNVEDFDAVFRYIVDNDATYLLQRSIKGAPFRELHAVGLEVPGVVPHTRRKISCVKNR